jgi:hypothetical protein
MEDRIIGDCPAEVVRVGPESVQNLRVAELQAHNVKEVESDTVRDETVRWFRESMSNRLNNEAGAIVVIMQRLHEADPAPISSAWVLIIKGVLWALAIVALALSLRRLPEAER